MSAPLPDSQKLKLESLADGVTRASQGSAAVEFWFPRPNVAMGRYTGTPTAALFTPVNEAMTKRLVSVPKLHVFADLNEISGFEPGFRERWTEWFRLHRSSVASCHILFRSRLVAIGIAMVGAALGGMVKTYSDPADFQYALRTTGV